MSSRHQWQDDLNVQQAKRSLRQVMAHLDLSEAEKAGFTADLAQLETLMHKLEQEVIQIAAFGLVSRGKSSLLNALLGYPAFVTGPTHGVTQASQKALWSMDWQTKSKSHRSAVGLEPTLPPPSIQSVTLCGWGGSRLELIDTPGLDEVRGETRAQLALQVAQEADLILFVVAGDMTRVEFDALSQLREARKPMLLVFNKIDQFPDQDRQAVYDKICNERVKELLSPSEVVMAAAAPRVARPFVEADGSLSARLETGSPQVDDLRMKILQVLHQEGRSLLALNTLLVADRIHQEVLQRKLDQRSTLAQDLIWQAARTKAIAVALNPLTIVDALGGVVIDVGLILKLSQLYGLAMTTQGATQLLQHIILSMLSLGAGELVAMLGLGSLKTLVGATAPFTSGFSLGAYASVALTQAALAGLSSYTVGAAAKTYLEQGAKWGPDGTKSTIAQILDNMDEASITARLRSELQSQFLGGSPTGASS
ncbi:MAG: GTP-binding protein [Cyanobacteriota bacterium]|nr:GTP-binding protein [Cyanobacteriota bacterium]